MKTTETKQRFIKLRAEGNSYNSIAKELHIAKSTCTRWNRELSNEIAQLKQEEIEELYTNYEITKTGRIELLGKTLNKIDAALEEADFSKVDPAKLLDLKLRYIEALKAEYTTPPAALDAETMEPRDILASYIDLLNRAKAGEVTAEEANKETAILNNMLRAYQETVTKAKIDWLEEAITDRESA